MLAQAWEWKLLKLSECHACHMVPRPSAGVINVAHHQKMEAYSALGWAENGVLGKAVLMPG